MRKSLFGQSCAVTVIGFVLANVISFCVYLYVDAHDRESVTDVNARDAEWNTFIVAVVAAPAIGLIFLLISDFMRRRK